jgi:hypothetical protein
LKRKVLLTTFSCLLSLIAALALLAPSLGLPAITYARSRTTAVDASAPVTYYGGPVMAGNMNVYAIFWFPGDQGDYSTYISDMKQYYQDVSGNRLYNMLAEYAGDNGVPSSTTLAGSWEDTGNSYDSTITLQDFINEVKRAINKNNWPTGGYNNYFPIYTLPNANVYSSRGGYHSSFGPQDHPTIFGYVLYCSTGTCGVPTHPNDPNSYATDGALNASAHEQMEAATDPGYVMGIGWKGSGEIADICTGTFGPTPYPYDQGQANQLWDNAQGTPDPYIIQEIESNTPLGCILGTS